MSELLEYGKVMSRGLVGCMAIFCGSWIIVELIKSKNREVKK
jgi:hypothetical protein